MPSIFDFFFKTKFKTLEDKINFIRKMIYTFSDEDAPGCSYLALFKDEYHQRVGGELGQSPTVLKLVEYAVLNQNTVYTDGKVKVTR